MSRVYFKWPCDILHSSYVHLEAAAQQGTPSDACERGENHESPRESRVVQVGLMPWGTPEL